MALETGLLGIAAHTLPIPEYLAGEVQSKLAYVDEVILKAQVVQGGERIRLSLAAAPDPDQRSRLEDKVQRVVASMMKGAIKPKVQVLEDYLDRPVPYALDPMEPLLARKEVNPEAVGIFAVGPLLSRLIEFFEGMFLELAAGFEAAPYRFPTLIPARYLERVNYFRAFPHSLSFVTHLRTDLDAIDHFAQHAACDEHGLNEPLTSFAGIETLLSPAVCYHLYFALAVKPLPAEQIKRKLNLKNSAELTQHATNWVQGGPH